MQLWMYADEHIADDDTLEASLDDIDEIVGVEGFAQAIPADWLKIIDPNKVQLPDYIAHNGTTSKRRAQAAKRQAAYRSRKGDAKVTRDSNASNGARKREEKEEKQEAPERPDGLDDAAWTRWLGYRQQIRKPLKPVSLPAAQRELAAFGAEQSAVVEQSIAQGWTGLFALKERPMPRKEGGGASHLPVFRG
jgi:hypothetical protein